MFRIEAEKLLLGSVLSIVIVADMLGTTMLSRILPTIPGVILVALSLVLLIRFKSIRHYSFYYLVLAPLLVVSGVIVLTQTKNYNFLVYILLIVLLYQADLEFVLKVYSWIAGLFLLGIIFLSLVKVIPNLQFTQMRPSGMVTRNSFGFIYPTDFASHCFYLFTAVSYLNRKKFLFSRSIIGIVLSAFLIRYTDARLNALSIIIVTLIFGYFHFAKEKQKNFYYLFPLFIWVTSGGMYFLTKNFMWSSPFYTKVNEFLSNRLILGNNAMRDFVIRYFGNPDVKFIGYGGNTETIFSYNYVDSSYIQMLFYYGIIPVLLLVVTYFVQSIQIYRQKNFLLLSLLALITVNCMVEAFWIRPSYNIFMFILFATLTTPEFRNNKSLGSTYESVKKLRL